MMPKDIIVVGASAGGVEALRKLMGGLPHNFPGSLLICAAPRRAQPLLAARNIGPIGPSPREAS
jgi:two-component system, chemotaxis family, protein-glutamate methylesterase/glutaminase